MTKGTKLLKLITSAELALSSERDLLTCVVSGESDKALSTWSTAKSIVVPRRLQRNDNFDYAKRRSEERGWPVHLRDSGGGATPQGAGIINVTYAFVCSKHPSIRESYENLCDPIIGILQDLSLPAWTGLVDGSFCDGEYNVVVANRKFAGTAQRRSWRRKRNRQAVLFAHALILLDADIEGSVAAINQFYADCRESKLIIPDAHVNLSDLVNRGQMMTCEKFAELLHQKYSDMLGNYALATLHQ